MKNWAILAALVACLVAGRPVLAADFADAVVAQLQEQGYERIETEVTWLGRVRIVAERDNGSREIILNPRTGEILRDLWLLTNGQAGRSLLIGSGEDDDKGGSGSGSGQGQSGNGGSDGDDSGDDDSGDDDSDDDSDDGGSDNSGSGNSGSGGGDDD